MNWNRLLALLLIVGTMFGVIVYTGFIHQSTRFDVDTRLGLDLKGGFEILYKASPLKDGQALSNESLHLTASILERRVNEYGIAEPEVLPEGIERIRVRLAGVSDEKKVREMLNKPAVLTFRDAEGNIKLNGDDFVEKGAQGALDPNTNLPIVTIEVKDAQKFADVTKELLGKELAIWLNDEKLQSPVVNDIISSGSAVISGQDTIEKAKELAQTINLGALPLKLEEIYIQRVGATLGQQSLESTVMAGGIASIIIVAFMIIFYRVPGIIASICIVSYIWFLLFVMNLMNVTLTLPGIAVFILAVGMAVDANIITYERLKEEIRSGKSIISSLRAGSKTSFITIMDANLTTIIAGAVLGFIGTGAVKGFAITLILSIVLSIITNVYFSKLLLHLLIRSNLFKKPSYFGVKESEISAL